MNRIFLLVGIGGFIGSISLTVNIVGCCLIGIIYALSEKGNILTPELRIFLATGFCRGFTTFSTFSYESINLINDGEWFNVSLYVAISVIIGFLSTYLGISLIKSI